MAFTIKSSAFENKGEIPDKYTCEGEDISPPLSWTGVPGNSRSLALIVDDPDAPDPAAPRMTWVHWVLFNIPPHSTELPENIQPGELPPGTMQGLNDWKKIGYGGPCPPVGSHRYFFKLYALDKVLDIPGASTKAKLKSAMDGHIIAETELIGMFQK